MEQLPAIYRANAAVPASQVALARIANAVKVAAVFLYTRGQIAINCPTITLLSEQVVDLRRQNALLTEQNSRLTEASAVRAVNKVSGKTPAPATPVAAKTSTAAATPSPARARTARKKIAA